MGRVVNDKFADFADLEPHISSEKLINQNLLVVDKAQHQYPQMRKVAELSGTWADSLESYRRKNSNSLKFTANKLPVNLPLETLSHSNLEHCPEGDIIKD